MIATQASLCPGPHDPSAPLSFLGHLAALFAFCTWVLQVAAVKLDKKPCLPPGCGSVAKHQPRNAAAPAWPSQAGLSSPASPATARTGQMSPCSKVLLPCTTDPAKPRGSRMPRTWISPCKTKDKCRALWAAARQAAGSFTALVYQS